MIKVATLLTSLILVASTTFAQTADDNSYSSAVGVQAIARSVVTKKLLAKDLRNVVELALETGRAEFGKMECDRATGSDYCSVNILVKDDEETDEAEEVLYRLDVRLIQGNVISAELTAIAG